MFAQLEEEHGLAKRAMSIYDRATRAVKPEDKFEVSLCFPLPSPSPSDPTLASFDLADHPPSLPSFRCSPSTSPKRPPTSDSLPPVPSTNEPSRSSPTLKPLRCACDSPTSNGNSERLIEREPSTLMRPSSATRESTRLSGQNGTLSRVSSSPTPFSFRPPFHTFAVSSPLEGRPPFSES